MIVKTRLGEFDLETYEENGVDIVTHTSLSLVLNNLRSEGKVADIFVPLTEQIIDTVNGVYLAEVRLKDISTGVIFRGIGEVNPRNIDTDIAKNNPIIMAFNRAEDKAFISLLGIEKRGTANKFYSSIEMPSKAKNNNDSKASKPTSPVAPPPVEKLVEKGTEQAPVITVTQPIQTTELVEVVTEQSQTEESPFMETTPTCTIPTIPAQTDTASDDIDSPLMPAQTLTPVQLEVKDSVVEAKETEELTDNKTPGEYIIPTGRLRGKKLSEADDNFLVWLRDATAYGSIPPKYTKEFVDAFYAFMAEKG